MKFFKRYFLFVFVMTFFFCACNKKISVQEFIDEVNKDEDFIKTYRDSTFHASCSYKPTDLMALTELRGELERNGKISNEKFALTSANFSNASYFTFKLGLINGEDILQSGMRNREEYVRRINDLTFNMGRYAYLLSSEKDTIRASIFDIQRSYGMSPDLTVLFAFPKERINQVTDEKLDFVYQDPYFGLPQKIALSYSLKELNKKLPEINLNGHE